MGFEERANRITGVGETNFRHHRRRFGIKGADRRHHMYILRNVLFSLLDVPGSTLLDVPRLFDDPDFRSYVVSRVQNAEVRRFWLREYQKYPANFRAEAVSPIQNKIGEFLVNPLLRRIV